MPHNTVKLLVDGRFVTIRPIRPSDAAMEAEFVHRLSSMSKHFRFFGGVSDLPAVELIRLCTVDGHESMAFVATVQEGGREMEIGVCRYAPAESRDSREMALTIADSWRHTDLARILVQHLIDSAKRNGIRELHAIELCDNQAMGDLARSIGMSVARDPADARQVIYSLAI